MGKDQNNLIGPAKEALRKILTCIGNGRKRGSGNVLLWKKIGSSGWKSRWGKKRFGNRLAAQGINNCNDVELVFPLGPVDEEKWIDEVATFKAFGQTPLYLAIKRALEEFKGKRTDGTKRHVVVLTDGENYVFKTDQIEVRPEDDVTKTKLAKIVNEAKKRDQNIDIVGMKLKNESEELENIARSTNGKFIKATTAIDIENALRELLGVPKFEVRYAGERVGEPKELGETITIENWRETRPYSVHLLDGENKELTAQRNGGPPVRLDGIMLEGSESVRIEAVRTASNQDYDYPRDLKFERFSHGLRRRDQAGGGDRFSAGNYSIYGLTPRKK